MLILSFIPILLSARCILATCLCEKCRKRDEEHAPPEVFNLHGLKGYATGMMGCNVNRTISLEQADKFIRQIEGDHPSYPQLHPSQTTHPTALAWSPEGSFCMADKRFCMYSLPKRCYAEKEWDDMIDLAWDGDKTAVVRVNFEGLADGDCWLIALLLREIVERCKRDYEGNGKLVTGGAANVNGHYITRLRSQTGGRTYERDDVNDFGYVIKVEGLE